MKVIEFFAASAAVVVAIVTCLTVIGCGGAEAVDPQGEVAQEPGDAVDEAATPAVEPTAEAVEAPSDDVVPAARSGNATARRSPAAERRHGTSTAPAREPRRQAARREEASVDRTSREPEVVETDGLGIDRVVMAREVVDRSPVGEQTAFSAGEGGRIYAYLEVANPEREEREITVAWVPADNPDREISRVEVRVGPHPRWRTWAYTSRLTRPGQYLAVVRDHEDHVIARAPFEVTL